MQQKVLVLNWTIERVMTGWQLLFRLSAAAAVAAGKVVIVAAAIPLMADVECLRQKQNCFDLLIG